MLYRVLYSLTYKVTYMKRVNFRISETTYDQLKQLAEQRGESMNAAVQYAVQSAVQGAVQGDVQEKPPEKASDDGVWRELFLKEHEKLLELTDKVADSLHASQTLQAMDKPALESAQQKMERKTRWQRLKEAWSGGE